LCPFYAANVEIRSYWLSPLTICTSEVLSAIQLSWTSHFTHQQNQWFSPHFSQVIWQKAVLRGITEFPHSS
jgi:hypothetical protein